jgi:hypothetical protein
MAIEWAKWTELVYIARRKATIETTEGTNGL